MQKSSALKLESSIHLARRGESEVDKVRHFWLPRRVRRLDHRLPRAAVAHSLVDHVPMYSWMNSRDLLANSQTGIHTYQAYALPL